MAILLRKDTKVLVQGITGREGSARAAFMKGYGTKVVAGVTPGRGGEEVAGIPVYNTVEEAVNVQGPVDASVTFVRAGPQGRRTGGDGFRHSIYRNASGTRSAL